MAKTPENRADSQNSKENPNRRATNPEELRSQARRKRQAGIFVGLGSVAAGIAISFMGIYGTPARSKLDVVMTEFAYLGVGILATTEGGLFAKELQRQADDLNRQARSLGREMVANHLEKQPEERLTAPPAEQQAQEAPDAPVIVLPPEAVAVIPTSSFELRQ